MLIMRQLWRWLGSLDARWAGGGISLTPVAAPLLPASTGCPVLDQTLGGGWQRGALQVVAGDAASGKTTWVRRSMRANLIKGQQVAYLDMEHNLAAPFDWGEPCWGSLLVGQPTSMEQMLAWASWLLAQPWLDLLVIDSMGWWIAQEECALGWGDASWSGHMRRRNKEALRVLFAALRGSRAALLLVVPVLSSHTTQEKHLTFVGELARCLAKIHVLCHKDVHPPDEPVVWL